MDQYGVASETSDPAVAAALFAEDAVYQETPFDEPMRGREAIYRYWSGASQWIREAPLLLPDPGGEGELGHRPVAERNHPPRHRQPAIPGRLANCFWLVSRYPMNCWIESLT